MLLISAYQPSAWRIWALGVMQTHKRFPLERTKLFIEGDCWCECQKMFLDQLLLLCLVDLYVFFVLKWSACLLLSVPYSFKGINMHVLWFKGFNIVIFRPFSSPRVNPVLLWNEHHFHTLCPHVPPLNQLTLLNIYSLFFSMCRITLLILIL